MAFKVRPPGCQLLLLNTCYYYSNNTSIPVAKRLFSSQLFISELVDRYLIATEQLKQSMTESKLEGGK